MGFATKTALLAASCLALGARQADNRISYRNDGASLTIICADLSRLTGENLKPSTALAKEVLAIRAVGVTPADLEKKIAESVQGNWVEESGSLVLKLDPGQDRKDRQGHQDLLIHAFDRSLQAEAKSLAERPTFEADDFANRVTDALAASPTSKEYGRKIADLADRSPSHRAIARLLATFSPSDFVGLPPRIRVVYSNAPNAAQRPLKDDAVAGAVEFVNEQTLWSNQAKAALAGSPRFRSLPDFLSNADRPQGAPVKLLVGLFRESENGRIRIDLKLADRTGKIVCQAKSNLKPEWDPAPVLGIASDQFNKPLTPSEESLEISPDGYRRHPMSDAVRQQVLSPLTTDPLSIGYGKTLTSLAESERTNLVADLSDQLVDGAIHEGMAFTEFQYLNALAARGQAVTQDQGWLMVKPLDPFLTRETRADRTLLQEYVQGEVQPSFPLERQAACAVGLPDPLDNFLPSEMVSALKGHSIGLQNVALLRFYGSLSEQDVAAAESDRGVGLASLSSQSIQYLNEVVYGEMGTLIVGDELQGVGRDPSECLADGYSANSSLTLRVESKSSMFDLSKDSLPYSLLQGSVTPGEIAFLQYSLAHPDRYPEMAQRAANLDTPCFCSGTYSRYDFKFKLAPNVSSSGELESRSLDNLKLMRLSELPDDFKAQVDAQYSQIEKDEKALNSAPVHPAGKPKV